MAAQSRAFLGVLYPDSETYDCSEVLSRLSEVFEEWAYITHDMDVDPDTGELKKAHIHWVGKLSKPALLSTIAGGRKLGIPENSVEFCKNWKSAVRYLVHKDSPDKYQYSPESVESSFDIKPILDGKQSELVKVKAIYAYIHETNCTSADQLLSWCIENDCWSEFRRSFAVWASVMREMKEAM